MFHCTINYVPLYNVFSLLYIKHYALTLYYIIAFLHSSTKTYKEECISDLIFSQWCSAGFRSVRNTLSLGKQFLTSSIPLWLLHPEDIHNSPSRHWESHTQQDSVKSRDTWLLSSTTVGTQNVSEQSVSTKLYWRQNIHATWARTTSLSATYLCCLHHTVRAVVFHWRQFSHVSAALIDAQSKLYGLFARPCNNAENAVTRTKV